MKSSLNIHSIGSRVIGAAVLVNILMAVAVGYALYAMNQIGYELEAIAEEDIPLTQKLTTVTIHQLEQAAQLERGFRFGEIIKQNAHAEKNFSAVLTAFNKSTVRIEGELHSAEEFAKKAASLTRNKADKTKFENVATALKKIEKTHKAYTHNAQQIFELYKTGDLHNAENLTEKIEAEEDQFDRELGALVTKVGQFTANAGIRAEKHERQAVIILTIIMGMSFVLGLLIAVLISRSISTRMAKAMAGAETIAAGDLTQDLTSDAKDETGQLLNKMNDMRHKLLNMLTGINGAAMQLSSAAEELSVVSRQTSTGVARQQSETDQVATAVNEMSATADEVARNAVNAAESAQQADAATKLGQNIVNDTISIMQAVAHNVEDNSSVVRKLNDDSDKIGVVLDVIRGIAEQTNLLALNAAIEAARAGEQGRGFAVVADEVRTLASRTQESTQEIQAVIEDLQNASKSAVQAMDQGASQARDGVAQAAEAGKSLDNITIAVDTIAGMNTQIASAAEEQSAVSRELERNLTNIANVATETQIASSSTELAALAVGLQGMVEEFKV